MFQTKASSMLFKMHAEFQNMEGCRRTTTCQWDSQGLGVELYNPTNQSRHANLSSRRLSAPQETRSPMQEAMIFHSMQMTSKHVYKKHPLCESQNVVFPCFWKILHGRFIWARFFRGHIVYRYIYTIYIHILPEIQTQAPDKLPKVELHRHVQLPSAEQLDHENISWYVTWIVEETSCYIVDCIKAFNSFPQK